MHGRTYHKTPGLTSSEQDELKRLLMTIESTDIMYISGDIKKYRSGMPKTVKYHTPAINAMNCIISPALSTSNHIASLYGRSIPFANIFYISTFL
jgi:hypothetical protein